MNKLCVLLVLLLPFWGALNVPAQQWTTKQKEVWTTIETEWQDEKDGKNWTEEFAHPYCIGWNINTPMAHGKTSAVRWFNVCQSKSEILDFNLSPLAIEVMYNMALAHYYYLVHYATNDGKKLLEKGRWTDIWCKEGNKWQLLDWQAGEDKTEE